MSRTTALKVRRSALIAVAAALLSGTAAGTALPGQGTQTVSAIGQRLEASAFTLADQRPDGFQTNLRGLNPFDALAGEMPPTLLSSSARRSYHTPRPIRHGYNDSATRRYWSVAALRQSTGVSLQALVSSTSDPGTHAQGPGSAALKLVSSRAGSVEGSFVPTSSGDAGRRWQPHREDESPQPRPRHGGVRRQHHPDPAIPRRARTGGRSPVRPPGSGGQPIYSAGPAIGAQPAVPCLFWITCCWSPWRWRSCC